MIDLEWVSDYIDISDQDPYKLATTITKAGTNIEAVHSNVNPNLVIGKVVSCKHIEGTHLNDTEVDVGGKELIKIVCGAPNVKESIKVIVALPGCKLPEGEIKSGKIHGHESNGMICALFEIGLEEKNDENYAKGIAILPDDAPIGENALKYLNREYTTYELDIHKHRNNDCYYHIGFAYEIGSILNRKVKLPTVEFKPIKENVNDVIKVSVMTDKCPYYSARMAKNIKIKESPDFIKRRLISAGMRPINNVVDISNYVMLEFGQPLHFFDYNKLGSNIVVRNAKENEKIITLDNKERLLSKDDILITDGEKGVCIAGVMGGLNTDVDDSTNTIVIESAIFNNFQILKTSKRLGLRSEASIRYGKGLDYEYSELASKRACYLLEKYADAQIYDGVVLYDKVDKKDETIEFKACEINNVLGMSISVEDIKRELDRLDFKYKLDKDIFKVIIPKRRLDIDPSVNDIAEEIGRLYGYNNLESKLPKLETRRGTYQGDVKIRKLISFRLRTLGLNETKTYTLTSPDMAKLFKYDNKSQIVLSNPMSLDKSVIRTSLLPSLLKTYEYNKARKVSDINIYEISKTYDSSYNEESKIAILMSGNYINNSWNVNSSIKVDFYILKGIIENLMNYLGFNGRYSFKEENNLPDMHPGICASLLLDNKKIGILGRVHPSLVKDDVYVAEISLKELDIKTSKIKFVEGNKYPEIKKDVAFIVPNDLNNESIEKVIRKSGGKILSDIELFDVYNEIEENKKSMAYNLTFKDESRTLSDQEVMEVFNKIIKDVENKLDAKLRNS